MRLTRRSQCWIPGKGRLVIFAGFTMSNFQRLRQTADIREAPMLMLSLFGRRDSRGDPG